MRSTSRRQFSRSSTLQSRPSSTDDRSSPRRAYAELREPPEDWPALRERRLALSRSRSSDRRAELAIRTCGTENDNLRRLVLIVRQEASPTPLEDICHGWALRTKHVVVHAGSLMVTGRFLDGRWTSEEPRGRTPRVPRSRHNDWWAPSLAFQPSRIAYVRCRLQSSNTVPFGHTVTRRNPTHQTFTNAAKRLRT